MARYLLCVTISLLLLMMMLQNTKARNCQYGLLARCFNVYKKELAKYPGEQNDHCHRLQVSEAANYCGIKVRLSMHTNKSQDAVVILSALGLYFFTYYKFNFINWKNGPNVPRRSMSKLVTQPSFRVYWPNTGGMVDI